MNWAARRWAVHLGPSEGPRKTTSRPRAALARHDLRLEVFGAAQHQWWAEQVAPEALDTFEQAQGVALPQAYRAWLAAVGTGAGPFYGLLPLPEEALQTGAFAGPVAAGRCPARAARGPRRRPRR